MSTMPPDLAKRTRWEAHLKAFEAANVSATKFCELNSLSISQFTYYKGVLRPSKKAAPKAFTQVKLPTPARRSAKATLYLDKFSLELEGDVTAAFLAELCQRLL